MSKKRTPVKGLGVETFRPSSHRDNNLQEKENVSTKVTFSISNDLLSQLDDVCYELKKRGKRSQVTKTRIIDIALREILDSYHTTQEKSKLYKQLFS